MDPESLKELLEKLRRGEVSVDEVLEAIRRLPFEDLGFAKVDSHRAIRCGGPEVIFCQNKTPEQVALIAKKILSGGSNLLATRATPEHFAAVKDKLPDAEYHAAARIVSLVQCETLKGKGTIGIVTAGTSDIPVAEEARVTAEALGNPVTVFYDVGVAGIHRVLAHFDELHRCNVLIVVAGMEGALASVVGGLVSKPVIGVPTSVGYGASFGGIAPLLTMLNSCATGVAVMNIDNGFGAAYFASLINHMSGEEDECKPSPQK